jgi:hypothetical protein
MTRRRRPRGVGLLGCIEQFETCFAAVAPALPPAAQTRMDSGIAWRLGDCVSPCHGIVSGGHSQWGGTAVTARPRTRKVDFHVGH